MEDVSPLYSAVANFWIFLEEEEFYRSLKNCFLKKKKNRPLDGVEASASLY